MDTWDAGAEGLHHPLADHVRAVLAAVASQDPRFFAAWDEDLRWCITVPCVWDENKSRLSVRDGQSRLSNLLTANRVLAELRALSTEIAEDAIQSRRLRGRLRATAEQDTGLPCIVFDRGARPTSSPRPGWAWARHTTDVLEYVALDGSTDYALRFSHEPPWSDDPLCRAEAALADVMKQFLAIRDIALAALGLLIGPKYSFAWGVPPNEASPCGVLRLAAPIVPGAPNLWSCAHKTTMTLAA